MKVIIAILILLFALPVQAGTWGVGQFDNDESLDRASDWAESGSALNIQKALEGVQHAKYIEAPEAMTALVAAEVVAAAMGRPSPDLPDDLRAWIERQPAQELVALAPAAKSALAKITSPEGSELYELWSDSDISDWLANVGELSNRLAATQPSAEP